MGAFARHSVPDRNDASVATRLRPWPHVHARGRVSDGHVLAFGIGSPQNLLRPLGLAPLACLALSLGAIALFYFYTRSQPTEMTATAPEGLNAAAEALRHMPGDGVLVLPFMCADYVAYASGKQVLWGGHCGDLRPLAARRGTRPR